MELSSVSTAFPASATVCGASLTLASRGAIPFTTTGSLADHCSNSDALEGSASDTGVTGIHCYTNAIDGVYGNSNSWFPSVLGDSSSLGAVGVRFPFPVTIGAVVFGRDATAVESYELGDRWAEAPAEKIVQYTRVSNPGLATQDSVWESAGQVVLTSQYRHVYSLMENGAPLYGITGLRIQMNKLHAIDELEAYETVADAEVCPTSR